jgi:hypothetical protein
MNEKIAIGQIDLPANNDNYSVPTTEDNLKKLEQRFEYFQRDFLNTASDDSFKNKDFFLTQCVNMFIEDANDILANTPPSRIVGVLESGDNWDTEFPIPDGYKMNSFEKWYYHHQINNAHWRAAEYAEQRNNAKASGV